MNCQDIYYQSIFKTHEPLTNNLTVKIHKTKRKQTKAWEGITEEKIQMANKCIKNIQLQQESKEHVLRSKNIFHQHTHKIKLLQLIFVRVIESKDDQKTCKICFLCMYVKKFIQRQSQYPCPDLVKSLTHRWTQILSSL